MECHDCLLHELMQGIKEDELARQVMEISDRETFHLITKIILRHFPISVF